MAKLDLEPGEMPPPASLNSTLGALKKFQEKRGFELLEWRPSEEVLYIIEPSFLFYVRWGTVRELMPSQLDLFEKLITRTWAQEGSEQKKELRPLTIWLRTFSASVDGGLKK